MSLALARKYRPRTFADVAVQSHVSNTLRGAIARGRVAHGYLFAGPRGVGKTTLARVLAMALNCERKREDGEPCGECSSCVRIWSGSSSLDVVEIDAASNRGVDDARELRERAMYAPSGDDRYKVYIVDEAHMLTREAWNALLKILEEPPPRVVFAFATTEPQKIAQSAAPVLSRLQRFDLKRIGASDIVDRLTRVLAQEQIAGDPDALAMIARAADGSMRDALSLTDQVIALGDTGVTVDRVRDALGLVPEDELLAVLDLIAERRAGDVFTAVARLADAGVDFSIFLTGLGDLLRAQLAIVLGGSPPDASETLRAALEERKQSFVAGDLMRMLHALADMEQRFRKSGQQRMLVEMLLVRFALMDRTVEIEELLAELGGGSPGGGGGSPGGGGGGQRDPGRSPRDDAPPSGGGSWRDALEPPSQARRGNSAAAAPREQSAAPSRTSTATPPASATAEPTSGAIRGEPGTRAVASSAAPEWRRAAMEAAANGTTRITDESLRTERLASLRSKDPLLGAAIDALDLELLD